MASVELKMSDAMRQVTMQVRVTGVTVAKARLWVGIQLIKLAAIVIGCGLKVEAE